VWAKIEHPIEIIKRVFAFTNVRYREFNKNAHRLTCAPANRYLARQHLLHCDVA
jgi:hypothetical protein